MGLNFLQVSAHSWAENTFTDMRNKATEYLDLGNIMGNIKPLYYNRYCLLLEKVQASLPASAMKIR